MYCGNNPVIRADSLGHFWETIFDLASFGVSIVEVCVNPSDPWAWAGLIGDAIDLIPFVTGFGEITRSVKTTVKITDDISDTIDAAKTVYRAADATSDIRKATGAYEILYKSGRNYVGKGGFNRAIKSAMRNATKYEDEVVSITWKSSKNIAEAFLDEYKLMSRVGVGNMNTFNKIWSPGRTIYKSMLSTLF